MKDKYKVYDLMTINPVTTTEYMSVAQAANIMVDKKVGSLLITKEKELVGLLTEKDIVTKIVAINAKPEEFNINQIMTPKNKLITISPKEEVYSAMILMKDNNIRRLPVIQNNVLEGMITMKDILKVEPDLFEHISDSLTLREETRKLR